MERIIFLVGAIILNMVLKSSKDKKRMEEARNKRISEGNINEVGKTRQETVRGKKKQPSFFEEITNLLNQEVDKMVEKKKPEDLAYGSNETKKSIRDYKTPEPKKEKWVGSQAKTTESLYKDFGADYYSRDGNKKLDQEEKLEIKGKEQERKKFKKDILNGFIFSEILEKPKSLRKSI